MITRTIKYTASDGTEHDSPQEAALRSLETAMACIDGAGSWEAAGPTIVALARNPEALRDALDAYFDDLEEHPDVDNEGPGDDDRPWAERASVTVPCSEDRLVLTDKARQITALGCTPSVQDWLDQGWTRQQMIDFGWAVELDPGEIAPGVRGFEMEVPAGTPVAYHYATGDKEAFNFDDLEEHPDVDDPASVFYGMDPAAAHGDLTSVGIMKDGEWQHFDVAADGTFTTDLQGTFTVVPEYRFWKVDPCILDESNLPVDHPQYCRPFGTKEK